MALKDREAAYEDIAIMSGRTVSAVRSRGHAILAQERQKARAWLQLHLRKNWASGTVLEAPRRVWAEVPTLTRPGGNRVVHPGGK